MKNKKDVFIRRVKRMNLTYFCNNNGQFSESFELPDDVITDDDAYNYAFSCEKTLLLHHKKYQFYNFERRFFYQLSDGVVVAQNGNKNDAIVKYSRKTGNIFVNGELTNVYRFLRDPYFMTMTPEGRIIFEVFLNDAFGINLDQAGGLFNFSAMLLRFVVFKHETVDKYSDYVKFKIGDVYKPFGLKEENL